MIPPLAIGREFTLKETADQSRYRILKNGEPYKYYNTKEEADKEIDRLNKEGE
jgi:hypothetical protein